MSSWTSVAKPGSLNVTCSGRAAAAGARSGRPCRSRRCATSSCRRCAPRRPRPAGPRPSCRVTTPWMTPVVICVCAAAHAGSAADQHDRRGDPPPLRMLLPPEAPRPAGVAARPWLPRNATRSPETTVADCERTGHRPGARHCLTYEGVSHTLAQFPSRRQRRGGAAARREAGRHIRRSPSSPVWKISSHRSPTFV